MRSKNSEGTFKNILSSDIYFFKRQNLLLHKNKQHKCKTKIKLKINIFWVTYKSQKNFESLRNIKKIFTKM